MSLKYHVTKQSQGCYVLPQVGGMRCPVTAFLDEGLYEQTDEALWQQAMDSASYPGVIGVYLMPDTHLGYSIPVGGVVVTEDVILQAGSGYDISCGVVHLRAKKLRAEDVVSVDLRRQWIEEVEKRVATGVGSHRPSKAPRITRKLINEVLRYGAKPLGVSADLCERQYIPVPDDVDLTEIDKAYSKCLDQLGSVGGGNHFVEMQVDRDDGTVWFMIHCGSRGYGWQTANEFFFRGAELRGLPRAQKEKSWLRADEDLGKLYWAHHNAAANYAVANRHMIVHGVREAVREVYHDDLDLFYEISHNLVQEETVLLPDGTMKRGFVHRKGATRAFPPGHPDLRNSRWETTGHPCLIPGSMFSGAAILYPLPGAARSGFSVNHGSGRTMGRNEAKRELGALQKEIDIEMGTTVREFGPNKVAIKGVIGNTEKTPLDECHHVYKSLDEVLAVLETERIAKVAHRLYPIANLKGCD